MVDVPTMEMMWTVLGGIVSGGLTGHFAARAKARHELATWQRSREAMVTESAATLLKDTVAAIAAGAHAACWLSWKAECDPDSLTGDDLARYDEQMRILFPKMLGGQAAIGIFCPVAAGRVRDAVEIIAREDKEIGRACHAFRKGNKRPLAARQPKARRAYAKACELCDGLAAQLLKGATTESTLRRLTRRLWGQLRGLPSSAAVDRTDAGAAGRVQG